MVRDATQLLKCRKINLFNSLSKIEREEANDRMTYEDRFLFFLERCIRF